MKKFIIILVVIILVVLGGYFLYQGFSGGPDVQEPITNQPNTPINNEPEPEAPSLRPETVLGESVEGRAIMAYHYYGMPDADPQASVSTPANDTELLFVGGIHGGYEWNTVLVAHELMDYLEENPDAIPDNVMVTVVPVLNPDGLAKVVTTDENNRFNRTDVSTSQTVVISGRFNGNNVDLNRNFDCDWQEEGTWQTRKVSGGTSAFSEPESQAIRNYIEANNPTAVVVWYSSAGGVFASSCHNGVLAETKTLTNLFAKASGYPAYEEFDFYEITGDMVNWLAKENIPAISVLLTTHNDIEWTKNRAGIEAIFAHYANHDE